MHFSECLQLWRRAEDLGYDWISHFDHLRPTDWSTGPCFEGTTLLAALAASTSRVRCGILVLGAFYRHPAVIAAIASTVDHISRGRLELGIGSGSSDGGQHQYGITLPSIGIRMRMLAEACQVMRFLWTQDVTEFDGEYYQLKAAYLAPKPLQPHLPLTIGGSGEKRMLRIVALHADIWNTVASDIETYRQKVTILASHCAEVGRNPRSLRRSVIFRAVLGDTEHEASDRLRELTEKAQPDWPLHKAWLVVGTPDRCIEELNRYIDLGAGDLLLGVRCPVDWQTIELVATKVAPALKQRLRG